MSKFEVGDKVKVVTGHNFPIGTIVHIENVDTNDKDLPYRCCDYAERGCWIKADEIEKIDDISDKQGLKVGDKVKVLSYEEIQKHLVSGERDKYGVNFTNKMKDFCGEIFAIQEFTSAHKFKLKNVAFWIFTDEFCVPYIETDGTKPTKQELKIGDRVIMKCRHGSVGKDTTGTIKKICDDTNVGIEFNDFNDGHDCDGSCKYGTGYYVYKSEVELIDKIKEVKPTEKELKIGDRVKLKDNYDHLKKGMVGAVKSNGSSCGVDFDNLSDGHDCGGTCRSYHGYYVPQSRLELIDETKEEKHTERTLKIGDRITMKSDYDNAKKGMTGTIKEVTGSRYGIDFDDLRDGHECHGNCRSGHGYYVNKTDVELIDQEDKVKPPTKSNFYNYLMTYSESNLRKFNEYLFTNSTTYYSKSDSKEGISDNIYGWLNEFVDISPRKAILNEMCKSLGIRDEYRINMLSEIDKQFGNKEVKATSSVTTSTKNIEKKKEENNMFNTTNLMENFMPSFATGDKFGLTMGGKTAVKRSNGEFVIYNFETETIENQADFVLKDEDLTKMFILMPTLGSNLVAGDLILNKETFYTVTGQNKGKITAVNMNTSANSSISKETNIIFGEKMYKKVVSLFEMGGASGGAFGGATGTMNPMMLMLMMGKDSKGDGKNDSMMKTMMLMQMMGGAGAGATGGMNPMMMAMMMGGNDSGEDSMMKTMMMMQMMGGANPFGAMMGGVAPVTTPAIAAKPVTKKKSTPKTVAGVTADKAE